ncbi:Glutathione S-transferase [Botryosphaeria dothidea]|uniref:Glutathione S-transferase n=1 Tax=Botryosphaeria dothidea TaxID=55169 RepID=A0A8H4IYI4_9PEZI|nr:Glutathione S-transferase [Botryosphaeria dothidea]
MAYRLISATPSPYARKVRIVLLEKGIPFDLLTEVPWDSTTTKPRHKPLEKLPILLVPKTTATSSNDPDGFTATVFESHHILAYLEIKHPDIDARLLALEVEVIADGVYDACVLLFFEKQRAAPSDAWTARQRRKVYGGIA